MTLEREFTDGNGHKVRVTVEIDEGAKLERAILELANRARNSTGGKAASALGGAVRVVIIADEAKQPGCATRGGEAWSK